MMLSFPAPANGGQPVQNDAGQTMRLRDDQPVINQPARTTRKRKSPAAVAVAPNPDQPLHHVLPPPHTLMHLSPPLPPGFPYAAPADYTPGGLPPGGLPLPQQSDPHQQPQTSASGRTLSNSKRAEQNRKAQRAFRERRDQHIKALESRSQLLDTALTSADEANRRWEHCRVHADQLQIENAALRTENATLRAENAALRAALGAPSALPPVTPISLPTISSAGNPGPLQEENKPDGTADKEMDTNVPAISETKE
ncbi:hypothetical protein Ac2012v2_004873 [Leucoagaricus gongylophorus]